MNWNWLSLGGFGGVWEIGNRAVDLLWKENGGDIELKLCLKKWDEKGGSVTIWPLVGV